MNIFKKTRFLLLAALVAAVPACSDLDVTNPNAPDRARALATPGDVEALVAGTFHTWWNTQTNQGGSSSSSAWFPLNSVSFQSTGNPANFANLEYSSLPRQPLINEGSWGGFGQLQRAWNDSYGIASAVGQGLNALEDPAIADELNATRLRAFGWFMLGLAHATVALQYDQGFIVGPDFDPQETPEIVPYADVLDAALGFFDNAINEATGANFTIPDLWMAVPDGVSAETLVELAHSMKARHMAAVARNPAERANAMGYGWQTVLNEINAGLDDGFAIHIDCHYCYGSDFTTDAVGYFTFAGWQQQNYFIHGMADQSGNYQRWLAQPLAERFPYFGSALGEDPFLIVTDDTRYPQGATREEQELNPGEYLAVPWVGPDGEADTGDYTPDENNWWTEFAPETEHFDRASRGIWRWSFYYHYQVGERFNTGAYFWEEVHPDEMSMLAAEAHIQLGNNAEAAALINASRGDHGLSLTDAAGTNTSCVPRLPNGTCGGLMEMMKWEKRLETQFHGLLGVPWYYDGRGWGDLFGGSALSFPIPSGDLLILGETPYNLGGCGQDGGAPNSIYGWSEQC